MSAKIARIGRPPAPPKTGERTQIGVQVSPSTKLRLEAEALRNERSISREAELRIEQSFWLQDLVASKLLLTSTAQADFVADSPLYPAPSEDAEQDR